jgi:hypothetical protein
MGIWGLSGSDDKPVRWITVTKLKKKSCCVEARGVYCLAEQLVASQNVFFSTELVA